MIFIIPLLIASLFAGAAWATQTPIGTTSSPEKCLSISRGTAKVRYDACCSHGSTSGKGSVEGKEFTYTCAKFASPFNQSPLDAANPHECAKLCAADAACPACSWTTLGKCYFATTESYGTLSTKNMLLIEKTGEVVEEPEPSGECGTQIDAAKAECEKEKAALADDVKKQCEAEKLAESSSCEATKAQLESEKSAQSAAFEAAKVQLEAEKQTLQKALDEANQKQALQETLDEANEKETLRKALEESRALQKALDEANEKQALQNALDQAKALQKALDEANEKQALQKALDEANKKLKETGTESVSQTSVENEALVEELSRANFRSICPKFGGKTFITTDSSGYKYEWKVHCQRWVAGLAQQAPIIFCPTQNVIKLLKDNQENTAFVALWINEAGACNTWTNGYVTPGVWQPTHHLILPTKDSWK